MELTLTLDNPQQRVQLFGPSDANLRLIRETYKVHITARDGQIRFSGRQADVSKSVELFELMQQRLRKANLLSPQDVHGLIQQVSREFSTGDEDGIAVYVHGRSISARTQGQQEYIDAILNNDLVFCTGPAGTGKTYLAVALAVSMLKQNEIRRIVLARPAVEAGEKLGFLPGDLQAKVNPYLRPLFDALGDMMDYAQIKRFLYNDIIEVIPLAFMRGRTLNDALIILDEAQNATTGQMMMFLTRLGNNSKMIVTGDDSQVDLEKGQSSGLIDALQRLKGIQGIGFVRLTKADIVRHRLVQNIVRAYERNGRDDEQSQENRQES